MSVCTGSEQEVRSIRGGETPPFMEVTIVLDNVHLHSLGDFLLARCVHGLVCFDDTRLLHVTIMLFSAPPTGDHDPAFPQCHMIARALRAGGWNSPQM